MASYSQKQRIKWGRNRLYCESNKGLLRKRDETMKYWYDGRGHLNEFSPETQSKLLCYPDLLDPRNYALSYIRDEQETYQVLRGEFLKYHMWAIRELYQTIPNLAMILNNRDLTETVHQENDFRLLLNHYMVVYYGEPSNEISKPWGYIYFPEILSGYQKNGLKNALSYFEIYKFLFLMQKEDEFLVPLNKNPEDFMPTLRKMCR